MGGGGGSERSGFGALGFRGVGFRDLRLRVWGFRV